MIIVVNHRDLRNAAAAIHAYCDLQDAQMKIANSGVSAMLLQGWQGQDANNYRDKWEGVNQEGSVAINLRNSLRNYAGKLETASDMYRQAQENVINRATPLMHLARR